MGGIATKKLTTFWWKRKRKRGSGSDGSGPKIDRFQNTGPQEVGDHPLDVGNHPQDVGNCPQDVDDRPQVGGCSMEVSGCSMKIGGRSQEVDVGPAIVALESGHVEDSVVVKLANRISCWSKLKRVVAYVKRFIDACRKVKVSSDHLSVR